MFLSAENPTHGLTFQANMSSSSFQVKKSKGTLEEEVNVLTEEMLQLEQELIQEQHRYKMMERRTCELMEAIARTQETDLQYLSKATQQMEVSQSISSVHNSNNLFN